MGRSEATKEGVEASCGDARLPTVKGCVEGARNPVDMPGSFRGQIDAGSPLNLHQFTLLLLHQRNPLLIINQVPLVVDDDDATPGIYCLLYDADVLLCQRDLRIDEYQRNLSAFQSRLRADGGIVVGAAGAV